MIDLTEGNDQIWSAIIVIILAILWSGVGSFIQRWSQILKRRRDLKKGYEYKVHVIVHSINSLHSNVENFSTNLSALLNYFAAYL